MRIEAAQATVERPANAKPAAERTAARINAGAATRTSAPPARREEFRPADAPAPPPHAVSIQMDEYGNVSYRLTNVQTGEVVREIPAEEIRRVIRHVAEMQKALEQAHAVDVKI